MKRALALSLSAALLLALLGACGSADDPATTVIPPSDGEFASVPPADTTQEPSLGLPTDGPTEEVSAEPSAEPPSTDNPTHHPDETHHPEPTHHPEESHHPEPSPTVPGGGIIIPGPGGSTNPSPEPSQGAGGIFEPTGPSASDINLANFYQTVAGKYEFPGMEILPDDFLASYIPGLVNIPCVQRLVSLASVSTFPTEIALIQVSSSADAEAVYDALDAHIRAKIDSDAGYNVGRWQDESRIEVHGTYILMIVNANCDAIVSDFKALF